MGRHLKHHLIHFSTHQDDEQTTWLLILSFFELLCGVGLFFRIDRFCSGERLGAR